MTINNILLLAFVIFGIPFLIITICIETEIAIKKYNSQPVELHIQEVAEK